MNVNWSSYPFLRFSLALILGIATNINSSLNINSKTLFFVFGAIYLGLFFLQKKNFKYTLRPILGLNALILIFLFGFEITNIRIEKKQENHITNIAQHGTAFKGFVVEEVKQTAKSYKTVLEINSFYNDSVWQQCSGKVLCYFEQDSNFNLSYGDEIIINNRLNEVNEPKNPAEFNYKKYLAFHQIHFQTYLKNHAYKKVNEADFSIFGTPNLLIAKSLQIRNSLEQILISKFESKRELGIALALVLGAKSTLEEEITNAYSGVGAMHVLAVSGLHVGLIYQVLTLIFTFFRKRGKKINPKIEAIFLIIFIWIYAFITGLSPSVVRAATMFSFIIIGNATSRNSNIYNTIGVSAFLLLCINPYLIVEVGFQLSYLAVLGIVYIQPKLYEILKIENKILDHLWSITSVSIAAQIATFPLSVLYFHQFPTYFFLSNIVVIPAAIIILYGGLMTILLSFIDVISNLLAMILEKFILLINETIIFISDLPNSLLGELNISTFESLLIYLFTILILVFLSAKKLKYFVISILIFGCFSFMQVNENITYKTKKEIIFYAVNNHSSIGLRYGNGLKFIADSSLLVDENKLKFHIKNHWWKENITEIEKTRINNLENINGNSFFVWNEQKFMIYKSPIKQDLREKLEIDYFIINQNPWIDKTKIEQNISYKHLIIDGSNNWRTRNFVSKNFDNVVNLIENGAEIFSF